MAKAQKKSRVSSEDTVIAPGFGTQRDLEKLARDLSDGGDTIPVEAVKAMMESRGGGIRRSTKNSAASEQKVASTPISSAWADFMQEEGVTTAAAADTTTKRQLEEPANDTIGAKQTTTGSRKYQLPKKKTNKKSKTKTPSGVLVQTGTLDSSIVGRTRTAPRPFLSLEVPTRILPGVRIAKVFTAGHACHCLALSDKKVAYVWGRNETNQLTDQFPKDVYQPTILSDVSFDAAAVGKYHTIILDKGKLRAVGLNKTGQCGAKSNVEQLGSFKDCVFSGDDEPTIAQVRKILLLTRLTLS